MNGKYIKVRKVVIPTVTMLLLSSMLFGVAACSKKEAYTMLNETDQIEIEYAVPDYDIPEAEGETVAEVPEQAVIESLSWLPLSSIETHPELRKAFEEYLNITGETGNKEGSLYFNVDTKQYDQNVTLYMVLRNLDVNNSFVHQIPMTAFAEMAAEHYADVDVDDLSAPYATINAYFELLPDQELGMFDGDSTITRAQAMALLMRATTPVNESGTPEVNTGFTSKVGKSQYTDFAAPMNQHAYINTETGLNEDVFNSAMSRGEYIYLLTNLIYTDYKAALEANGYIDQYADNEVTLTIVTNGGDITFSEAISDISKGIPADMYNTFKLAIQYSLIPEYSLADWDSSITKSEAIEILINMVKNYSDTAGQVASTSSPSQVGAIPPSELESITEKATLEGVAPGAITGNIDWNAMLEEYGEITEEMITAAHYSTINIPIEEIPEAARGKVENNETSVYLKAALGYTDNTGMEDFQNWVRTQGADHASGWTFIYLNGSTAGNQPTFGVYMRPGSSLYGTVYHVGDIMPNGNKLTGTAEEFKAMLGQGILEQAEKYGDEIRREEDRTVIVIN